MLKSVISGMYVFLWTLQTPRHVSTFMMIGNQVIQGESLKERGFSGWTQAIPFLDEHFTPIRSAFALDCDAVAAATFATNYGSGQALKETKDYNAKSLHATDTSNEHVTFQCDVRSGWWCQFTPRVDTMTLSPPCPSWSLAHAACGLGRADGFLSIEAFLKRTVLQPEVACFENVAHFRQHHDFQIVLEVLQWLGWTVRWEATLDLADILPQKRDRFLMVLTRIGGLDKPSFAFLPWDK